LCDAVGGALFGLADSRRALEPIQFRDKFVGKPRIVVATAGPPARDLALRPRVPGEVSHVASGAADAL